MTTILRRWTILPIFALSTYFCPSATAQHEHAVHGGVNPAFAQEMMQSMAKMDKDMMAAPMTGDPDHDFAVLMIPHHQDAVDMATAVLLHGKDPVLRRLAQEIIVTQQDDAEDVTQETICRAWSHYGKFDTARSLEAWLTRIAVNLCIDTVRRRQRQRTVSLDTPSSWDLDGESDGRQLEDRRQDPCLRLMEAAVDENLEWALHSLPASYLRCVRLLEQKHSYAEISALPGCPVGTIRSRLFRARALIRQ